MSILGAQASMDRLSIVSTRKYMKKEDLIADLLGRHTQVYILRTVPLHTGWTKVIVLDFATAAFV
jgi:hypothetical protein